MKSRVEFSLHVKLAAKQRANGRCENCTACLAPGKFRYDHRNPCYFSEDATLENCQVLCIACHDQKTAKRDIPAIAKSRRIQLRHAGIKKPRSITMWRNFKGEIVRKGRER